ncbi:hypothetical protein BD560DRAFT_167355 [Blakeslea trispora]|nr:hypothetical protein BD560DRAFT_167355 [Blakeslea trispora]
MGKSNDSNLWAPPVPGLNFDLEGPTADHLIDTSDIYEQTVYDDIHASGDEWTIVDENEAAPYLPKRQVPLTVTLGIDDQKTEKLSTFGFLRLDESFKMKRGFVINAGISVWGLDFVPKSTTCRDPQTQYLAIAGYRGSIEEHVGFDEIQSTGTYKNAIQIWNMSLSTQLPSESPFLDLCLLHDFGIVHELKWCPYGAYQEETTSNGEANKLGILSIVCGDGSVRTVVVPHPNYVRDNMCQTDPSKTVYMKINKSRCQFQLNTMKPISLAWGGHKKLAVGYADGKLVFCLFKRCQSNTKDILGLL